MMTRKPRFALRPLTSLAEWEQITINATGSHGSSAAGVSRRTFLRSAASTVAALFVSSRARAAERVGAEGQVMTVLGPIDAGEMGFTLTHEHALADVQPIQERAVDPRPYDVDEAVQVVLPHLQRLRELGCRTFVDATATGLGRDAALLRRLSEESGLHVLVAAGDYAAADEQFLSPHVLTDTVDDLAQRWIDEWTDGIGETGVRPGFIKLGFDGGSLTGPEDKLIRAAAATHLATGLTIGAHTGPAASAFAQLAVLEELGVDPSAWIWIHAQNEPDVSRHIAAARRGAWISFDGLAPESVDSHVAFVRSLRDESLLGRTLVSHDAGWYTVGEPRGGDFRPYDTVFEAFIPALRQVGFTEDEINTLFVANPADAFSINARQTAVSRDGD